MKEDNKETMPTGVCATCIFREKIGESTRLLGFEEELQD
jgi:hypothetical protein